MRETIFILVILLVLVVWTLFRYRKQIMGIIGVGKMIREAASGKLPAGIRNDRERSSVHLAKCSVCGINVPTDSLRQIGDGSLICDRH